MNTDIAILVLLGYVVSKAISPLFMQYLMSKVMLCKNYLGNDVISGMGLVIYVAFLITCFVTSIIYHTQPPLVLLLGCSIITLVGFLDDLWGNNLNKGLKGHLEALLQGNLTTGCIKATAGLTTAVIISSSLNPNIFQFILNIGIISLNINSINLFDLRPGRAIKYFLLNMIIVNLILGFTSKTIWLFCLLGIIIYYLPLDLNGQVMLGDTGSNLLGFILGYYAALITSGSYKLFVLAFLILIHWYSERKSITSLISQVRVLSYLDMLGRPKI